MNAVTQLQCPTEALIGNSEQIQVLRSQVAQLATCDVTVLLQGESGVGKELVSRMVHSLGARREGPFIGVNCAAIHESLLESELFGHEAGAFTGAQKASLGFLRAADGGTILLDEVGDMSPTLQSKLLRVLEDRAVVPVGGTRAIPIDVRVIAATHRDLAAAVREGAFRQDLYYRLNVVRLTLPALREHRQDIPLLARRMLAEIAAAMAVEPRDVSDEAMEVLMSYHWPGNVRQLGNVIQRAYVLGSGTTIQPDDLPAEVRRHRSAEQAREGQLPSLQEAIRLHVAEALRQSNGVRARAAKMLDIDRKSLWRMMRRYKIA